ncbi:hypothetical protein [Falsiphaeobacter marinintestinus]|uniref:hypothetical protein n=1 Tax=Falsiphaeobacter marinintestinus TaxID=1492905 RepID=UPI0011B605DB|nr:hypothetical protein [Phaeobacter marinintestinus]
MNRRQQTLKDAAATLKDWQKDMIRLVRNYPGARTAIHANTMGWKGEGPFNMKFGGMCRDVFMPVLDETPPPMAFPLGDEGDDGESRRFFSGLLVNVVRTPDGLLTWALTPDAAVAFADL